MAMVRVPLREALTPQMEGAGIPYGGGKWCSVWKNRIRWVGELRIVSTVQNYVLHWMSINTLVDKSM